jgi:hypothetical protein
LAERKNYPLRLDPEVYEALRRWAEDELRSVNAQIEFLLARALREAGRGPRTARPSSPPPEGRGEEE